MRAVGELQLPRPAGSGTAPAAAESLHQDATQRARHERGGPRAALCPLKGQMGPLRVGARATGAQRAGTRAWFGGENDRNGSVLFLGSPPLPVLY